MNARELIDALGAGDLDAEVYVALPGETCLAPLAGLDDVSLDLDPDDDGDEAPVGLVLWPAEARRRIRPAEDLPLVRVGQGDSQVDWPEP